MRTPLCDTLQIEYPVLAFSHCRDVVAAVSKAGGLGVLGVTALTPEQLDVELSWIRDQVGGASFGVDVLVPGRIADSVGEHTYSVEDDPRLLQHREFLASLMEKYDVPQMPGDLVTSPTLDAAMIEHAGSLVEVALTHPIRLVASALGPPPPAMVEAAHERDVPVAALVGTKTHAERQVAAGVDIIVAQGYEAGGHVGEIGTIVLVPEVVDAVDPIPVLAAGGIASGRQVAAALALGAQGVWTGSVWLTTEEAETNPVVKEKFLAASSSDTVRSRCTTGKPARQLRSAWTDEWDSAASPGALPMPLQSQLVNEARQRIEWAARRHAGARDLVNYFVGQVVGSLNEVRPARRVLFEMMNECADVAEYFATQAHEAKT